MILEKVLEKFVVHWKQQLNLRGILLTGSYAVGLQNENSDVDIRLILKYSVEKSFKGLETIDEYCFSYMGRSKAETMQKFNHQFFSNVKMEARIYAVGKIVHDPFGDIAEILKVAHVYSDTPLIKKEVSNEDLKLYMYSLSQKYQFIEKTTPEDAFYDYNYILYLKSTLAYYAEKLNIEMNYGNDTKLFRFLIDEKYLSAYKYPEFQDKTFRNLWISALIKKDKNSLNILHNFLEENLCNFNKSTIRIEWKK